MLNSTIHFSFLWILLVLFGLAFHIDHFGAILAFASEVDDNDVAPVDVELVSSITKKVSGIEESSVRKPPMTMNRILIKAGKRGLGGGLPGALAGAIQVLSLMWVRYVL